MIRPVRAEVRTFYLYFCPFRAELHCLQDTQGVALGYEQHWAFSPFILNPKLKYILVNLSTCQPINQEFRQRVISINSEE